MKKSALTAILAFLLTAACVYAAENDVNEITKEMSDFHGQAAEMLNQLEKATAAPNGGMNTLDEARKKVMRLASDDRFLKSAGDLWQHSERNKMLLIQLGFFLFMLIIKAWRQAKTNHWFKRLLVGFFLSLTTWIGLAYVIPLAVLGEPFAVFTSTLFRVLLFSGP